MKIALSVVGFFMGSLCVGCESENSQGEAMASIVAGKAFDVAKANSVDFSQYSIQSIQLLRDGQMGTIDDSANDEYISSVRKKLKGKKYWEACYMVSADMVAGAKYCYYFEYGNLNHFATYSVK